MSSSKKFTRDVRPSKKHLFILLFIFFILGIAIKSLGILINITPSMLLGIYIRANGSLSRGDLVAFCLPEPYQTIGIQRSYLAKGTTCYGSDPLIKQIVAVPGDDILLRYEFIQVNGKAYQYPTRYVDNVNRVLSIYPRGSYKNTSGYWLIGTHSGDSWDSRYWGSISAKQILYKLHLLIEIPSEIFMIERVRVTVE